MIHFRYMHFALSKTLRCSGHLHTSVIGDLTWILSNYQNQSSQISTSVVSDCKSDQRGTYLFIGMILACTIVMWDALYDSGFMKEKLRPNFGSTSGACLAEEKIYQHLEFDCSSKKGNNFFCCKGSEFKSKIVVIFAKISVPTSV